MFGLDLNVAGLQVPLVAEMALLTHPNVPVAQSMQDSTRKLVP